MKDKNVRCESCKNYFEESQIVTTGEYLKICDNCSDEYKKCNCCGELYDRDNLRKDKIEDGYYCENCP